MKRYDLSKIMKRAHNLYKNTRAKYQTFADALRKSWNMAKFEAKVADKIQVIEAETKACEAKELEAREQAAIKSVLLYILAFKKEKEDKEQAEEPVLKKFIVSDITPERLITTKRE